MIKKSFRDEIRIDYIFTKIGLHNLVRLKNRVKTVRNLKRNRLKPARFLEIGPGLDRIAGFETVNIINQNNVDYILDIAKSTIFKDNEFDLIYASHVLEHVPWYQTSGVLKEFYRILKPGGSVEIWVPDGLKICKTFVESETTGENSTYLDNWYRFNDEKDPCKWAAGRIFTYGDGTGNINHPNWHRAIFSPRYLKKILSETGFTDVVMLESSQVRGYNHGWINLGLKGIKAL